MADKKQYKWEVRPGGTLPPDTLNVKAATDQTGSTSTKHLTQVNQNHTGIDAKLPADTVAIATATSTPDSRMASRTAHIGQGKSGYDHQAVSVVTATTVVKPSATVSNADKTERRHNGVNNYS